MKHVVFFKKYILLIFFISMYSEIIYSNYVESTYSAENLRVVNNVAKDYTADSLFLNPALLNKVVVPEVFLTYNILYPNLTDKTEFVHYTAGMVSKLFIGGIGVGVNQFGVRDWYTRNKIVLSYGCDLTEYLMKNLALGAKIEYNYEEYSLDEYMKENPVFLKGNNNSYISASLAVEYFTDKYGKVAAVVENINKPDTGISTTDVLPLVLNLGFSYSIKNLKFLPGVKLELGEKTDWTVTSAFEYKFLMFKNKINFLPSLGVAYGSRELNKIVLGFALNTTQLSFSYGLSVSLQNKLDIGNHQCVSVSYKFIPLPPEEEKVSKSEYDKLVEEKIKLQQELEQIKKFATKVEKPTEEKPTVEQPVPQLTTTEEMLLKKIEELEKRLKEAETKKVEERPKPAVTTPTTPPVSPPKKRYHTVVAGDTLPKLAEKYYGDASQWRKIYEVNRDKIIRGQLIPGSVLEIP